MKKIQSSLIKEYTYLNIFLDDLKKIEEICKNHCSGNFCIKTEEYEFESIEELSKHLKEGRIKSIELNAYDPSITLDVWKYENRLYSSAENDSAIAAFHNINEVLLKCRPKMSWLYNRILSYSIIFSGFLFMLFTYKRPETSNTIFSSCFIIYFFYAIKYFSQTWRGYSKILLIEKNKQSNFFQRNKDQLVLILITSFLTILGTLFIQKYLSK